MAPEQVQEALRRMRRIRSCTKDDTHEARIEILRRHLGVLAL